VVDDRDPEVVDLAAEAVSRHESSLERFARLP